MFKQNARQAVPGRSWAQILWFILVVCVSSAILNLPQHPNGLGVDAFLRIPLEVVLLGLLLLLIPRRMSTVLIPVAVITFGVILCLKLADLGTQTAFQRPFNPYLDVKMLQDGWNLLSGTLGTGTAALACMAVLLAFLVTLGLLGRGMRGTTLTSDKSRLLLLLPLLLLAAAGSLAIARPSLVTHLPLPRFEFSAARYLSARLNLMARTLEDMRRFEAELQHADPIKEPPPTFAAVSGRDVILIFIESYGRSAIEDPLYAPLIGQRLNTVAQQLDSAGFSMASRWIGSPTVAGLSWLAHGTFLSGLWVDSQSRYDRLMMSERTSLNRLFSDAGWESVAVMPAITMDWPESAWYGYNQILAEKDLGYRGKPFNWVTMPDQFTLSAFQRMVRDRPDRQPVMAEIALISSHAPWTPVPRPINWNDVGDGSVFNEQATSGETPTAVWADPAKVRTHYIRTIDYSLETLGEYISRYGDNALFLIIGDHQPAAIVTGADASRAVPMHVISRDSAVVDRFRLLGFDDGLTPTAANSEIPMSQMRDLLVQTLSAPG
ncbi:sulfatase [Pararhizobium antarcticum]|uniref:Sulfatase n=1 Tax=Pararhizobium antarcticum TaxID=1798805 RepID=A0A657LUV3_9HYPH|nr:sulfatase [Pararhizobium antarcticum]OJF96227.1 sulfatase [Rhizobium sp. 58]OJF97770.1 sulfatase [Pararhizobium antarcticum]